MAITRTKADWSWGDKLTSAQVDAIDTNITNALDKRTGQTDTLASDVSVTGDLALSGSTDVVGSFSTTPAATVNLLGTVTLGTGGTHTINITNGSSRVNVSSSGKVLVGTSGEIQIQSGATQSVTGSLVMVNGATQTFASGSSMTSSAGSTMTVGGNFAFTGSGQVVSDVPIGYVPNSVLPANIVYSPARTVTQFVGIDRIHGVDDNNLDSGWVNVGNIAAGYTIPDDYPALIAMSVSAYVSFSIPVINGATLSNVELFYGVIGSRGGVPANPLALKIVKRTFPSSHGLPASQSDLRSGGAYVSVPSSNLSAYQLGTTNMGIGTYTPNQNNTALNGANDELICWVRSEYGTNAIAEGNVLYGLRVTWSVATLNPN